MAIIGSSGMFGNLTAVGNPPGIPLLPDSGSLFAADESQDAAQAEALQQLGASDPQDFIDPSVLSVLGGTSGGQLGGPTPLGEGQKFLGKDAKPEPGPSISWMQHHIKWFLAGGGQPGAPLPAGPSPTGPVRLPNWNLPGINQDIDQSASSLSDSPLYG